MTEEETGWKMIHGDVFRPPALINLFCAIVGAGAQIFATVLLLLSAVLIGAFKVILLFLTITVLIVLNIQVTKRGALLTAMILIYALCALFGGLVAARIFKQLKG